ncbi:hypothetical protein MTO96_005773 [Rhipicephalus appendiculatus]
MGHNRAEGRRLVTQVFEGRFEAIKQQNNMTKEDAQPLAAPRSRSPANYPTPVLTVHYYVLDYVDEDVDSYFRTDSDHAPETTLVFGLPMRFPGKFEESDRTFSLNIMNAWATFAKRG